jgi:hypothetical protein
LATHFIGLVSVCEKFHCLPQEGGLYDQDSFITYGMSLVTEAQEMKQAEEQHNRSKKRR